MDFGLGFDTPCLVYDKGGGSLRAFRRARFIDAMAQRKSEMGREQLGTKWRKNGPNPLVPGAAERYFG